jgi:hypothetical protein
MKSISCVSLIAVFGVSACVSHTSERTVEHDQPVVQKDVVVVDPHRDWWDTYHRDEQYDRDRALEAHRMWCDEHPSDTSCHGW